MEFSKAGFVTLEADLRRDPPRLDIHALWWANSSAHVSVPLALNGTTGRETLKLIYSLYSSKDMGRSIASSITSKLFHYCPHGHGRDIRMSVGELHLLH